MVHKLNYKNILSDCMHRSLSLYYNDTKITFNKSCKNENVQINILNNSSTYSPYIIEKKIKILIILLF